MIQWPSCFTMRTRASGSFIKSGCAAVILTPNHARMENQKSAHRTVTRLNTPKDMRAMPAGMEIKWRMTGKSRAKKTPPTP